MRGPWIVVRDGVRRGSSPPVRIQDRTTGNGAFTHFTRLYSLLHPTCLILPGFSFSVSPHTLTRALESGPRVKQTAVLRKKRNVACSLHFSLCLSVSVSDSVYFFTLFGLVLPRAPALADAKGEGVEARRGGWDPWVMIVCRHQHHLSVV